MPFFLDGLFSNATWLSGCVGPEKELDFSPKNKAQLATRGRLVLELELVSPSSLEN